MANIYKGTLGLIGNTPLIEAINLLRSKITFQTGIFQSGRKRKGPYRKSND